MSIKLYHTEIDTVIDISETYVPSLVIEEPTFFRSVLTDLYAQTSGEDGRFTLSNNDKNMPFGTWVEVIDNCLQLNLNTKPLVNKILSAMEKTAMAEDLFLETVNLLQQLEVYVNKLAFSFDCDIVCERCTVAGVLKGIGIALRDDYEDPLERLADYMELVREFDRDKLFVLVNLRTCFADSHLNRFLETVRTHGYRVLLLDCFARDKLELEKRITIDNDLCEF